MCGSGFTGSGLIGGGFCKHVMSHLGIVSRYHSRKIHARSEASKRQV